MYTKKPRQSAVFSLYDPCPAVGADDPVRPVWPHISRRDDVGIAPNESIHR